MTTLETEKTILPDLQIRTLNHRKVPCSQLLANRKSGFSLLGQWLSTLAARWAHSRTERCWGCYPQPITPDSGEEGCWHLHFYTSPHTCLRHCSRQWTHSFWHVSMLGTPGSGSEILVCISGGRTKIPCAALTPLSSHPKSLARSPPDLSRHAPYPAGNAPKHLNPYEPWF
jgi:hypothetical protein